MLLTSPHICLFVCASRSSAVSLSMISQYVGKMPVHARAAPSTATASVNSSMTPRIACFLCGTRPDTCLDIFNMAYLPLLLIRIHATPAGRNVPLPRLVCSPINKNRRHLRPDPFALLDLTQIRTFRPDGIAVRDPKGGSLPLSDITGHPRRRSFSPSLPPPAPHMGSQGRTVKVSRAVAAVLSRIQVSPDSRADLIIFW